MNTHTQMCNELGPIAYSGCNDVVTTCHAISQELEESLALFIYTLFALGALYALNGLLKTTDLSVRTYKHLTQKKITVDPFINVIFDDMSPIERPLPSPTTWEKTIKVWDDIFKVGKNFGKAALCVSIALPLFKLIFTLQSTCTHPTQDCNLFKGEVIHTCNWAEQWIINVVKKII